jgi:hypothetical protein
MNTARAFGPAAVQGFPNDSHWIVRWAFIPTPPLPTGTPPHDSPRTCFSQFVFFFLRAIARGKNLKGKREKRPLDPHLSPHVFTRLK